MSNQHRSPDATLQVNPASGPQPVPPHPSRVRSAVTDVLDLTSLHTNAGQPARVSNLSHENITATVNRGAQNAVANQQAHAQLNLALVGKIANRLQNLQPITARSSVEILTDNDLAEAIAALKAAVVSLDGGSSVIPVPGFDWARLLQALRRLLAEIIEIEKVNERLTGDGSLEHPYHGSPLYATASVTLGFPDRQPSELELDAVGDRLRAEPPPPTDR
jgi:DNA-binding transcriptional MocR family regulator